jgi:spore coat polysaccharide biosynthesis protein SpsF
MSRTVAVIQARLGSYRLPQKMLATIGDLPIIEWVVTRVRRSELVDRVIVATTLERIDDRLVEECERLGVEVKRGATDDVLKRFVDVLVGDDAGTVVRVCGDNPLIDPECIDRAIREFRDSRAEYAFNHRPLADCNYADGFGAEVVSRNLLERLNAAKLSPQQREHVTLALVDGTIRSQVHACVAPVALAHPELRFDVDTREDLLKMNELVDSARITVLSDAVSIVRAILQRGVS